LITIGSVELLLIRHAEPVRTVDAAGPADPPLGERGQRQAELLGPYLADEQVERLYTSPLRRALQTAELVAAATGLGIELDDGIAEFDRHDSTYVPIEEMRATRDPRFLAMLEDDFSLYGVDMDAFRSRAVAAVEGLVAAHPGGRVAAVCHGGVINAYVGHVLGLARHTFFLPDYTSINRVAASRGGVRSLLRLNEVAHLRGHDLLVSTV
jgi:2,3-bisphosphoglycerate-dependent phosphoglycerate mutase